LYVEVEANRSSGPATDLWQFRVITERPEQNLYVELEANRSSGPEKGLHAEKKVVVESF
jgi:hypothetical protein